MILGQILEYHKEQEKYRSVGFPQYGGRGENMRTKVLVMNHSKVAMFDEDGKGICPQRAEIEAMGLAVPQVSQDYVCR